MTSVLSSRPSHSSSVMPVSGGMSPMQEPTPPDHLRHEDDRSSTSARVKPEHAGHDIDDEPIDEVDDNQDNSSNAEEGPSRKRRRSRKGLDKKFECPQDGCGKSYSRAEHLFVTFSLSPPNLQTLELTHMVLAIAISLTTTPSKYTNVIFQNAIGNLFDSTYAIDTKNDTRPRDRRSAEETR